MDQIDQHTAYPTEHGREQSRDVFRSVEAEGREYGQKLEEHPSSAGGGVPQGGIPIESHVGDGRATDAHAPLRTNVSTATSDRVDSMDSKPQPVAADVGCEPETVLYRRKSTRRPQPIPDDGSVNVTGILQLLKQQGFRCALSDRPLSPETASLDHVVPICRGGAHRIQNTQVLHRDVNRAKGTLTNEEFIRLCGEVWSHAQQCIHPNGDNVTPTSSDV